jgi:hypothetical protein
LPSVALGKEGSAHSASAKPSLPSTFSRALGKVPVDGGGSDNDDPWSGVDDGVIIGARVAGGAYDGDTVDGGVEGAKHDGLMEEGLGVVGERRVLAEGDEDDVSIVMDGRLEVHEDGALAATHFVDQQTF